MALQYLLGGLQAGANIMGTIQDAQAREAARKRQKQLIADTAQQREKMQSSLKNRLNSMLTRMATSDQQTRSALGGIAMQQQERGTQGIENLRQQEMRLQATMPEKFSAADWISGILGGAGAGTSAYLAGENIMTQRDMAQEELDLSRSLSQLFRNQLQKRLGQRQAQRPAVPDFRFEQPAAPSTMTGPAQSQYDLLYEQGLGGMYG